jgi:hypothetical protein
MKQSTKSALSRLLRGFVAILIAGIVTKYSGNEYYISLAPFINATFKWLRDEFGLDIKVL